MAMNVAAFILAIYGAILSTALGYLAYLRERRRLRIWFGLEAIGGPSCLVVHVVCDGPRPVAVHDGALMFADGGCYSPTMTKGPHLPRRLEDGDEIVFRYVFAEVDEETAGFLARDTSGREYRQRFSEDFIDQASLFRQVVAPKS
jgi:hypothetical protein